MPKSQENGGFETRVTDLLSLLFYRQKGVYIHAIQEGSLQSRKDKTVHVLLQHTCRQKRRIQKGERE